jgi:type II secretory pathway pseudopilin PulG
LVAIALFSIAVSIAAGGIVRSFRTQRQLVALIAANSNASLTLENMAREMRTAYDFACNDIGCTALAFTNAGGDRITYSLESGVLMRDTDGKVEALTASNVEVRNLNFVLLDAVGFPPRITVSIGVGSPVPGLENTATNIQTTVSSRAF